MVLNIFSQALTSRIDAQDKRLEELESKVEDITEDLSALKKTLDAHLKYHGPSYGYGHGKLKIL